jgi:hypothetical protein
MYSLPPTTTRITATPGGLFSSCASLNTGVIGTSPGVSTANSTVVTNSIALGNRLSATLQRLLVWDKSIVSKEKSYLDGVTEL